MKKPKRKCPIACPKSVVDAIPIIVDIAFRVYQRALDAQTKAKRRRANQPVDKTLDPNRPKAPRKNKPWPKPQTD